MTPDTPPSSVPESTDWYTIPEAAEYLGISRPTLFRWMKDGVLSFYKVGRSTRFSKEGLDSVIEKTTGLKEAESVSGRCLSCGHGVLVDGRIQGNSRVYFRPDRTRFWTLYEAMVPVRARVCIACGHLHLRVEPEKVTRLMPDEGVPPDRRDKS